MKRIVPGKTHQKLPIILKLTLGDIFYLLIALVLIGATLALLMLLKVYYVILLIVLLFEIMATIVLFARVSEFRLYYYFRHIFMYLFRKKDFPKSTLGNQLGISFNENAVKNENGEYSKIIFIKGIDFNLVNEETQDIRISQLSNVLSNISKGKIIKMDEPIRFSYNASYTADQIKKYTEEYDKIEDKDSSKALQLASRIYTLSIDLEIFENLEEHKEIETTAYYLILYNVNLANLNDEVNRTIHLLNGMNLASYELNKKEVLEFYKEYFDSKVNVDKKLTFNHLEEHPKYVKFGDKNYCVQTISDLPYTFDNAWLATLSLMPGIKLVVNFMNNPDLTKAIKRINKRILTLGEMMLEKQSESEKLDISIQIEAYQALLEQLKFNKEQLHILEIMFIYEYSRSKEKEIAATLKNTMKCRIDPLTFRQNEVFINTFPNIQSKNIKWLQRDFPTSSFSGSFPFISDLFIDKEGDYIGFNSGPLFFDMWANLNEKGGSRSNANIMTIGASGKGKSYLQKILIKNQLIRGSKVFILDPENEYSYIAERFYGEIIDVTGGAARINPFEIFPEFDEEGKSHNSFGLLSKHLAFLSDFFRVVMSDLSPFTRQVLQNKLMELYNSKGIYSFGYKKDKEKEEYDSLSVLSSGDYPTFSDLIELLKETKLDKLTAQEKEAIVELRIFLKDFEKEGRFGVIWNGPTSINIDNDFVLFNFRGVDSSSGNEIKNGQMLLITKYLMKEIINNYQFNYAKPKEEQKKVILLVDEAHNFIDPNFPVALDMMKNMAKRIRKYNGSLWVATQNIADFIGFDVNTRTKASAIMNNCQYTFLFGMKPDDIAQIKDMYSKSTIGALTEEEVNYLTMAAQGDALLLVDASNRISFHVNLKDPIKETTLITHVE